MRYWAISASQLLVFQLVTSLAVGMFYFGKKGTRLHCDILFKKNKDALVKSVYLTAMYRCDRVMITTLNIADAVLKEYKKDGSSVSMLARCYHGSLIPEAMV